MKVRKGGVTVAISPSELKHWRLAGWKKVDEPKPEMIKKKNDRAKLKREKLNKG